jgi:putative sugar O-methyltransferase
MRPLLGPLQVVNLVKARRMLLAHENTIVFVTPLLRPREIKMSTALRRLGWKVILLYRQTTPFRPLKHFDVAIKVPAERLLHSVAKFLSPRLCHVFSGAVDDTILAFCRDKPGRVIIDLNDVFCPSLFNYLHERFEPTKECLMLADGLVSRDLQAKVAERDDGFSLPDNIILFPEYSWIDGPSAPDARMKSVSSEDVSIVSVGSFTLEKKGMFDSAYLELARRITDSKIHFHIYPHWFYRNVPGSVFNFNESADFSDFIELSKETPFLHLHESLPIEELARELPAYDFGIVSGGCEELGQKLGYLRGKYMDSCYSGRIADYLDARLPILVNPEVKFNFSLLKRRGVVIDLRRILAPGFRDVLLGLKQDVDLHRRVSDFSREFSVDRQAPRLAAFYAKVIKDAPTHESLPWWVEPFLGSKLRGIDEARHRSQTESRQRISTLQSETAQLKRRIVRIQNVLMLTGSTQANASDKTDAIDLQEVSGLLNWTELSDPVERDNGYYALMRIQEVYLRHAAGQFGRGSDTNALTSESAAWSLLNAKNLDQLIRDGYRQFKRTIALNYFTFPVQEGDPQIAALEALVSDSERSRLRELSLLLPDDAGFAVPDQSYFRYFVMLLWTYARAGDRDGLLEWLEEPLDGNPILVPVDNKMASSDLANSVLQYYSMRGNDTFTDARRILEIGGGYGRNAFVIASAHPNVQYVMVDVPPAIYIAQRYLSGIFRDRKVFQIREFASYTEIREEVEAASFVFLLPHQLGLFPDNYFDLTINISSFGEMTRAQIEGYFSEIDRLTTKRLFSMQWQKSPNPFDGLILTEADYPIRPHWQKIFSRPNKVQEAFFESLYDLTGKE